jgi:hypothetical protein
VSKRRLRRKTVSGFWSMRCGHVGSPRTPLRSTSGSRILHRRGRYGNGSIMIDHDDRWRESALRREEGLKAFVRASALGPLRQQERGKGTVTPLFATMDETHNQAVPPHELLRKQPRKSHRSASRSALGDESVSARVWNSIEPRPQRAWAH